MEVVCVVLFCDRRIVFIGFVAAVSLCELINFEEVKIAIGVCCVDLSRLEFNEVCVMDIGTNVIVELICLYNVYIGDGIWLMYLRNTVFLFKLAEIDQPYIYSKLEFQINSPTEISIIK